MTRFGDNTWEKLLNWSDSQKGSERLATQVLRAEKFESVDPSHPLGGVDGGRDAIAIKDNKEWVLAVYFPRGQQSFNQIQKKFKSDYAKALTKGSSAFIFVTNQELTLTQRQTLKSNGPDKLIEIYHLERIAQLLDTPALYGVRLEFLGIEMTREEQVGFFQDVSKKNEMAFADLGAMVTGGNSFCYFMLYNFDMELRIAKQISLIKVGNYAVRDLSARIVNLQNSQEFYTEKRTISSTGILLPGQVQFGSEKHARFNIFFNALNGCYVQELRMVPAERYWATATRVIRENDIIFESIEDDYLKIHGNPDWK